MIKEFDFEKQKTIEPKCFLGKMPRWLELIFQLLIFNILLAIAVNIGIMDFTKTTNETKIIDNQNFLFYFFISFLPIIYLLGRTRTFVNQVVIDFSNRQIRIKYTHMFFINKRFEIPFNEFSFNCKETAGWGNAYKKLKIFQIQFNKKKRKITIISNAHGWSSQLVKELEVAFNIVNDFESKVNSK